MKVLIIEDEPLAAERLQILLNQLDNKIEIAGFTDSVTSTIEWFNQHQQPDLILSDIQLADGFSFEIFRRLQYKKPIIFTTAFNQYALDAFNHYSIAYIVKPVTYDSLSSAIEKFKQISGYHQSIDYNKLLDVFKSSGGQEYKTRFLAKVGQRMFFVPIEEVNYFLADNKIVYLIDKEGNKLTIDYTLEKLETLVDPKMFFRLNRQILVRYNSIQQIKPYINNRLKLLLKNGVKTEEVVVARERVAEFKTWAEQ